MSALERADAACSACGTVLGRPAAVEVEGSCGTLIFMNSDEASAREWQEWHHHRLDAVRAPYGPLSVTGTHWLAEADAEGRLEGVPGRWRATEDGVELRADVMDGLTLGGEVVVGLVRFPATGPAQAPTTVTHQDRWLELLQRDGQWAVRVHDPDAAARRTFSGIRTTPFDPGWVLTGGFTPYDATRSVRVANADGQDRCLELGGTLRFTTPGGVEGSLAVSVVGGGALWAVFADGTSGESSYYFRFLRTSAPDAEGAVSVDFNRATLPPCALVDHFLCPFPPPGNTLVVPVPVGERDIA